MADDLAAFESAAAEVALEAGGRGNDFLAGDGLSQGNALLVASAALDAGLAVVVGAP